MAVTSFAVAVRPTVVARSRINPPSKVPSSISTMPVGCRDHQLDPTRFGNPPKAGFAVKGTAIGAVAGALLVGEERFAGRGDGDGLVVVEQLDGRILAVAVPRPLTDQRGQRRMSGCNTGSTRSSFAQPDDLRENTWMTPTPFARISARSTVGARISVPERAVLRSYRGAGLGDLGVRGRGDLAVRRVWIGVDCAGRSCRSLRYGPAMKYLRVVLGVFVLVATARSSSKSSTAVETTPTSVAPRVAPVGTRSMRDQRHEPRVGRER